MKLSFSIPDFINDIEKMRQKNRVEYIDAIVTWCEKHSIEVEYVAGIIKKDPVLRSKLEVEAEGLNIIKRVGSKLPF
jgi:hypothetical protein